MQNPEILICDSTLREGEQTPGVEFSIDEKREIARLLNEAGVHEIECGTPAMMGNEKKAVAAIVDMGLSSRIISWNRAVISDIRHSIDCGVAGVAVSIPVSDFHLKCKLGKDRKWVLDTIRQACDFAKDNDLYVCVGAEDASRADDDFLVEFARNCLESGADRLRFSDTLGIMEPFRLKERISFILSEVQIPIEIHAHNDFGLATANLFASMTAGASYLSATLLGLGERAGTAALEQVVMGLKHIYDIDLGIDMIRLIEACRFTAEAAGVTIPSNAPILGESIFHHETEIHVAGIIRNPGNYEPFTPESVNGARKFLLGKYSGRRALGHYFSKFGAHKTDSELRTIITQIRS
jgi:homocitrate synthase NifV